jgi:hypothetical protein
MFRMRLQFVKKRFSRWGLAAVEMHAVEEYLERNGIMNRVLNSNSNQFRWT